MSKQESPHKQKQQKQDLGSVRSREGLLEDLYGCLESGTPIDTLYIPHSDVFFVREALEDRFDCELTLEQVEEYMCEAGWNKDEVIQDN